MMSEIKKIEATIADLEKSLAAARKKHENLLAEDPQKRLARELHELLCCWNHTDGCSWFYEITSGTDDWDRSAHGEYLAKARNLTMACNRHAIAADQAIEIFKIMKGI